MNEWILLGAVLLGSAINLVTYYYGVHQGRRQEQAASAKVFASDRLLGIDLQRVAGPVEAVAMTQQTIELAKLGYNSDGLERIARAAENSEIIAFEYGTVRHLGRARTIQEIARDKGGRS